jgi:hypothetical protein
MIIIRNIQPTKLALAPYNIRGIPKLSKLYDGLKAFGTMRPQIINISIAVNNEVMAAHFRI